MMSEEGTPVLLNTEGGDTEDVEEEEEEVLSSEPCLCLFCSSEQLSATATLDHCRKEHGVDLLLIATKLGCDFYSCIKLVNYIRKESPPPSSLCPLPLQPYPWDDDSYYHPVLERDPLLQLDWELEAESTVHCTPSDNDSASEDDQLSVVLKRLRESEEKTEEYKVALVQALADLQNMRLAMGRIVGEETSEHPPKTATAHTESESDEEERQEVEDGYFGTYSYFSIHHKMLSDRVRTGTYQTFISKNTALFKDKVVLDIGCGTGILSLFAAQSGAKHVIGVDKSCMIYNAMQIIRENGCEDKITLIKGKVEELQLPVDKVDVIISEWMGCFLLFESVLDTIIFARDKWLQNKSHVYPNTCCMKVVAMGDRDEWETRVAFWEDVYGFKMSCLKKEILKEASVQTLDSASTISSAYTLKDFDVSRVTVSELEFEEPFQLTVHRDTLCHAIVGYFEVGFVAPQHTEFLKTGPLDTPTHWEQTVFYLQDPIPVHTGDVLEGTIAVTKNKQNPRALNVALTFTLSSLSTTQSVSDRQKYGNKYVLI